MPETAGRSLESMDSLFERPWYTVWKVAYPKPRDLVQGHQHDNGDEDDEEDVDIKPRVSYKS